MSDKNISKKKQDNTAVFIGIGVVVVLGLLLGAYFVFFNKDNSKSNDNNIPESVEKPSVKKPGDDYELEFVYSSSSEALKATETEAKKWADDAKLFDCTGMTTSTMKVGDKVYEYVGAQEGKYNMWNCTYYSKNRKATTVVGYSDGEVESPLDEVNIGEYGYVMYDSVKYPGDLSTIADSPDVYSAALSEG